MGAGFPGARDTTPGGHTLTRMSPDGKKDPVRTGIERRHLRSWAKRSRVGGRSEWTLFLACPQCDPEGQDGRTVTTIIIPWWWKDCGSIQRSLVTLFSCSLSESLTSAEGGTGLCSRHWPVAVCEDHAGGQSGNRPEFGAALGADGITIRAKRCLCSSIRTRQAQKGWTPRVRKMGADGKVRFPGNGKT